MPTSNSALVQLSVTPVTKIVTNLMVKKDLPTNIPTTASKVVNINEVKLPVKDVSNKMAIPLSKEATAKVLAMPIKKASVEVVKSPVMFGGNVGIKQAEVNTLTKLQRPILENTKQSIIAKEIPADKSRYFKYPEPQKAVNNH
jgi:hypothetical protein